MRPNPSSGEEHEETSWIAIPAYPHGQMDEERSSSGQKVVEEYRSTRLKWELKGAEQGRGESSSGGFKEPWVRRDEPVMGGHRLILSSKPIVLPQIEVSGCDGSPF